MYILTTNFKFSTLLERKQPQSSYVLLSTFLNIGLIEYTYVRSLFINLYDSDYNTYLFLLSPYIIICEKCVLDFKY